MKYLNIKMKAEALIVGGTLLPRENEEERMKIKGCSPNTVIDLAKTRSRMSVGLAGKGVGPVLQGRPEEHDERVTFIDHSREMLPKE